MPDKVKYRTVKAESPLLQSMASASAWEWRGDPTRADGYTVIGSDEDGLLALRSYDSLAGATSVPLADGIAGEWIMDREKAEELHDRIAMMDRVFWPGFNPVLARVVNREVVETFQPPEQTDGD